MKPYLFSLLALLGLSFSLSAKPLKVYLLVGQSNMQGHAAERTLKHLGMDPKTAPLLKAIQNTDGTAKVHDQIWISSIDILEESGVKEGKLTVGYGAGGREPKIGEDLANYAAELETYAKSLSATYGQKKIQFLYSQPASSLVEGITPPKIPGAKSISFDQWPKSLKNIAAALAELTE